MDMVLEFPVVMARKCRRCSSVKRDPIYPARCANCGAPVRPPLRLKISGYVIVWIATAGVLAAIAAMTT